MKKQDKWSEPVSGNDSMEATKPDKENSIFLEMPPALFSDFQQGWARNIDLDVDNDTWQLLLENIDGNLLLCCDEMPVRFYGCYFWNKGKFPYLLKKSLQFVVLVCGKQEQAYRINGYQAKAGERCDFLPDGSVKPNPNGDACVWRISLELAILESDTKTETEPAYQTSTYLLRWNPGISSFKLDEYRHALSECPKGFGFNWSVYEWENAHEGDRFYMLRTGDEYAGIVFRGVFTSNPYAGDDWAGKGKPRHYMDMFCQDCQPADERPPINIDVLEKVIPDIDWRRGHSGQLLTKEDAAKLDDLWKKCYNHTSE